jgi:hypothetical protein
LNCVQEFQSAVAVIHAANAEITLSNILQQNGNASQSLQCRFTDMLDKKRYAAFVHHHKTQYKYLQWLTSTSDTEAGRWLQAVPKYDALRFSNKQYIVQLRYRLNLPQLLIAAGRRCTCRPLTPLDAEGHHLITGCGKDGYRNSTHDTIAREIMSGLNYAGIFNRREEMRCFQEAAPDNNMRPDISIEAGPFRQQKTVYDLSVTCPLSVPSNSSRTSTVAGRAANKTFDKKNTDYLALANANGLGFLPIILESTGYVHKEAKQFFKDVAAYASEDKKIPADVIYRYLMTRISCVLQQRLSAALIGRCSSLNGRHSNLGHAFSYATVRNFDVIHTH